MKYPFLTCLVFITFTMQAARGMPAEPNNTTQSLLAANPGLRTSLHGEELTAIYGVPFAEDSSSQTTTQEFVEDFLAAYGSALGVNNPTLVLQRAVISPSGKYEVFTYSQQICEGAECLPVHGTMVKIPVLKGDTEKIGYVGIALVQPPDQPLPADVLDANGAIGVVAQSEEYGDLTTFSTPEKVILEAADRNLHRAWRFEAAGVDPCAPRFLFFVDTNTGDILRVQDLFLDGVVGGRTQGYRTPCCLPNNEANEQTCPMLVDLGEIEVKASTSQGSQTIYSLPDGTYEFDNLAHLVRTTLAARLKSEWLTVYNVSLGNDADLPEPGLYPSVFPDDDNPQYGFDFTFNPTAPECTPDWPDPEVIDQVNAYDGITKMRAWFENLSGQSLADVDFTAIVNHPDWANNAGSSGRTLCFGRGIAFSVIVAHEFGHSIIFATAGFNQIASNIAFHEGLADALSALYWNTPAVGPRHVEFADTEFDLCATLPPFCANCGDDHCLGTALGSAWWDLRKELMSCDGGDLWSCSSAADCPVCPSGQCRSAVCDHGFCSRPCWKDTDCGVYGSGSLCTDDSIAESLMTEFLYLTDPRWDDRIAITTLLADDDDADLTNGTPHRDEIVYSFVDLHGWSDFDDCGQGSVLHVDWQGPSNAPVAGVDYLVDLHGAAENDCRPDITLLTTKKDGQFVSDWFIGRTRNGEPANLGEVKAAWNVVDLPHDVRVEVGGLFACRSLKSIDIPPQSSETWSSLSLQLTGHLPGYAKAVAAESGVNAGTGGRIGGSVAGRIGKILAKDIGSGADTAGAMVSFSSVDEVELPGIAAGSTLSAFTLGRPVHFPDAADFSGTLHVLGDLFHVAGGLLSDPNPDVEIGPGVAANGDITVDRTFGGLIVIRADMQGNIATFSNQGLIQIFGDMHGDISAEEVINGRITVSGDMDGNIVVTDGPVSGTIDITGTFNGDICGSNLLEGQFVPLYAGSYGPNASVCGAPVCAAVMSELDPIPKSRFASLALEPGADMLRAIAVELTSLHHPPNPPAGTPDFSAFEGQMRYVNSFESNGYSLDCLDSGGQPSFKCATLGCEPEYRFWGQELNGEVLHITGPEIAPSSVYTFSLKLEPPQTASCAQSLVVQTGVWGDVVGPSHSPPDGVANVLDIPEIVNKVKDVAGSFSEARLWLKDVNPAPYADAINVLDISRVVDAVLEKPYPAQFAIPSCPSEVLCSGEGAVSCEDTEPCGGGPCIAGFCRDLYGRCTEPQ